MSHDNTLRMWNDAIEGGDVRPKLKIVAKTSAYTITSSDFGTVFTTREASGAVTFTLPAAASTNNGEWVLFINVADQDLTVRGTAGELVVFNDLTADAIAFDQGSELIGGAFLAISDGTSWTVVPIATDTQTITVTSA